MSNILDIPQIAVFDPGNLQNDLHIGFTGDRLTKCQTLCEIRNKNERR